MSDQPEVSAARERLLQAAEALFMERGYAAVKLKDIAATLGLRTASLYSHLPSGSGKEELYVEVVERALLRHRDGLETAIDSVTGWHAQLHAAADWFFSQPPMDLTRMVQTDLPALSPDHAAHLDSLAGQGLFLPVSTIFRQAQAAGDIRETDPNLLTGAFLSFVQSIHNFDKRFTDRPKLEQVDDLINVFSEGLRPR